MMKRIFLMVVAAMWCHAALAQAPGVVTRPSQYSVAETMDRAEAAVKSSSGFQVFSRIDFQALAASQGGTIRPSQLLIFGRGTVLQPLLPTSPVSAIDLPLKLLVWEDAAGKVMVSYNTGEYLAARHAIKDRDDVLKRVTEVTAMFVDRAAQ